MIELFLMKAAMLAFACDMDDSSHPNGYDPFWPDERRFGVEYAGNECKEKEKIFTRYRNGISDIRCFFSIHCDSLPCCSLAALKTSVSSILDGQM